MQRETLIATLARKYAPQTTAALRDYATGLDETVWQAGLDKVAISLEKIQKLAAPAVDSVQLQDVHPEWMLKVLADETPRVIAILLRYIPSKQARTIMDRLPARIKDHMPHFVDAFSVPTAVVQAIRRQFESHFLQTASSGPFTALGHEDLPKLICDIGLQEMALAFADADPRSVAILMKRLPETDARRLQERMHNLTDSPRTLCRGAKFTILDIDADAVSSDQFLFEVGLRAFAKAWTPADVAIIRALSLKLEPRVGEWILSQIARQSGGGELGGLRQQIILDRLATLSQAGVLAA